MRAADFLAAAEALPIVDLPALTGGRGIVIVAPHPDDESLGCGGLIAQACARGITAGLVVLSDGTGSHAGSLAYPAKRLRDLREEETRAAMREVGLDPGHIRFLRLADRFVPASGPVAEAAARATAEIAQACDAGTVAVTWRHDPHGDHQAAAAIAALVPAILPGVKILAYPVWGWALPADAEVGDAPRGIRLDISAHVIAKVRAIAAHRSQTSDLIDDDPTGFRLDAEMLARFARPFEIYLETGP